MTRRPQRETCTVCGKSAGVRHDGALSPHLSPHVSGTPHPPRCPGGFTPPIDGLIRPVTTPRPAPVTIPADRTLNSIRTVSGGAPGSKRR